jgi:hypothetical protein
MKRFITLMVIPHNDEHVREFNLAAPILWVSAGLVVLFIGTAAYFAYGYYARQGAENAYAGLKTENGELENHTETLRARMKDLSGRVSDLSQADTRMRAFARMTEPTVHRPLDEDLNPVQGAYGDATDGYASLDQLTREAGMLSHGFERVLSSMTEAGEKTRHIPSIFPVQGEGWYSSTFGYRTDPITGQPSFNSGIDIAGRKGTPIVVTADGRVDAARYHKRLGSMVSIDHGNGLRTVYAHLESHTLVKTGQTVTRGEVIGKMSRSGRTTAVNLHYAVIRNNKAQDPLDYIFDSRERRTLF